MKLLKEYKKDLLDCYLSMHWSQWNSLGVQTHIQKFKHVIDIEALIISTFFAGSIDKRLFLAMVEWIELNREWVSLSRIKNILKKFGAKLEGEAILKNGNLLIKILNPGSINSNRMKNVDNQYLDIFAGYKKRGIVQSIVFNKNQSLQLNLRSIFGVNARADIVLFLLAEKKQNANKIASEIYYDQKIVYHVLKKWELSGFVRKEIQGKEKLYSLEGVKSLAGEFNRRNMQFINRPIIFFTLGRIISILHSPKVQNDVYLISSQLRKIYPEIVRVSNYINLILENESNYPGEELFYYLKDKLIKIFKSV